MVTAYEMHRPAVQQASNSVDLPILFTPLSGAAMSIHPIIIHPIVQLSWTGVTKQHSLSRDVGGLCSHVFSAWAPSVPLNRRLQKIHILGYYRVYGGPGRISREKN